MPGLTLWLSPDERREESLAEFETAQATMLHGPDYRTSLDFKGRSCLAGHVSYPEYPFQSFQYQEYWIAVEGEVYVSPTSDLRRELAKLFPAILQAPATAAGAVRHWISEHDGDYVVLGVTTRGENCVVFSDLLGRLPLYLSRGPESVLLAREPKFIARFRNKWAFDRIGVAQHLWFGYPFGERTLWDGIERLPEALLLQARVERGRVEVTTQRLFDSTVEVREKSSRSLGDYADELASEFIEASRIRARHKERKAVVSLSGGHDSRSVIAALARVNADCVAATFWKADGSANADVEMAARTAAALGVPWERTALQDPGPAAADRMVWMKDGLNYVGMAFLLEFLDALVARWGRGSVYWTGDGGRVFREVWPSKGLRDLDEAATAVAGEEEIIPASLVEGICSLPAGTLVDDVRRRLEAFPERDPARKAEHWKYYERDRKWNFEGEDRNRCFLWTMTPFYSVPVYNAAMRIPDRLRDHFVLFREVQRRLSPSIIRIPNADIGQAIGSPLFRWRLTLGHRLPRWVKNILRGRIGPSPVAGIPGNGEPADRFQIGTLHRGGLAGIVSEAEVRKMLANATRRQLDFWKTLVLLDKVWSNRLTLKA